MNRSKTSQNRRKPNTERAKPRPNLNICLICLKSKKPLKKLEESISLFYEELCSFSCKERVKNVCSRCFNTLKKCYHFHKQCEYAMKILNEWYSQDEKERENVNQLYEKLESCNFENSESDTGVLTDYEDNKLDIQTKNEETVNEQEIKLELLEVDVKTNISDIAIDTLEENSREHKYNIDTVLNKQCTDKSINNDDNKEACKNTIKQYKIVKAKSAKETNIDDIDLDDDDMTEIEFIEDSELNDSNNSTKKDIETVKKKKVTRTLKTRRKITEIEFLDDSLELNESNTDTKKDIENVTKKKRVRTFKTRRQPLKNLQEYEKVFDIQLCNDPDEAKEEFAQRKFSEHYLNGKHKCEECYTVFKSETHLKYHKKWHDPSRKFACPVCTMRFNELHQMNKHRYGAHIGRFACKQCPLVTYNMGSMARHYRKHAGFNFKCKLCDKVFRHQSSLFTHQRTSHASEHVCVLCARTFISELGLRQHHNLMHKGKATEVEDGVRCDQCNITFINKEVYLVHIKNTPIHKEVAEPILACKRCGLEFNDKSSLTEHNKKLHPKNKPVNVKCQVCDMSGKSYMWLHRHMRSEHDGTPFTLPFLCTTCGRSFTTRAYLEEHERIHTGVKPYICDFCQKAFISKARLGMHIDIHKPPARKCKVCGKKFRCASNLGNHMRIHKGDRRYICQICGKGFLHACALKHHINGVHLKIKRVRKSRGASLVKNNLNYQASIVNDDLMVLSVDYDMDYA